jgi:hypothetical protein
VVRRARAVVPAQGAVWVVHIVMIGVLGAPAEETGRFDWVTRKLRVAEVALNPAPVWGKAVQASGEKAPDVEVLDAVRAST